VRKTCPMMLLVYAAVAAVGASCAQQSVKDRDRAVDAQAAKYGVSSAVLEMASRQGYGPRIYDGKTIFCRDEAQTGSMVPSWKCVDAARLQTEVLDNQQGLEDMQQRVHGAQPCKTQGECQSN
jgi:hypothetical protein